MMRKEKSLLISIERIEKSIFLIRDHKVMLDEDLARLYLVRTKALVQAVKRNIERFPQDFMFQLTTEEYTALRSQIVTSKGKTGRRTRPYVFTENGVAMLSSVLQSERAVDVNIQIMRTFTRIREMVISHKDLVKRLDDLERKHNAQFKVVFNSIRELIEAKPKEILEQQKKRKSIGFERE